MVRFTLYDLSINQYKHALSGDAPTTVASTGDQIGLSRAENVREVQLLIRGPSPAANNVNAQYEIPRAVQAGSPAPALSKTGASGLAFEFMTLDHMTASATGQRFGRLIVANS